MSAADTPGPSSSTASQCPAAGSAETRIVDLRAGRRVAQRVLDEVGERLHQQLLVAFDLGLAVGRDQQRVAARLRIEAIGVGDGFGERGKVERDETAVGATRLPPGRCAAARRRSRAIPACRRSPPRSSPRIPRPIALARALVSSRWNSRVSGVRRSCATSLLTWRRLSISAVMRSSMWLSVPASRSRSSPVPRSGHAPRQVALDDRFRGARDRIDAAQESLAEQHAAGDPEHRHERRGAGEGGDDRLLELVDLAEIAADREKHAAIERGDQRAHALGLAAILRGLGNVDRGPARRQAGPRRASRLADDRPRRPARDSRARSRRGRASARGESRCGNPSCLYSVRRKLASASIAAVELLAQGGARLGEDREARAGRRRRRRRRHRSPRSGSWRRGAAAADAGALKPAPPVAGAACSPRRGSSGSARRRHAARASIAGG